MNGMKIHPAANLLPMMSEDELQELAADIAENGQRLPIVMDGDVLIDGRNRLAACKLAGVDPVFKQLDGRDPLAYIWSANCVQRHFSKGQQAMVMARMYPEPFERGRGKKGSETLQFSKSRLSQARTILRYSPALAEQVRTGTRGLDDALEEATRKQHLERERLAKMEEMRAAAGDLFDRYTEGKMPLEEVLAVYEARLLEQQRVLAGARRSLEHIKAFPAEVRNLAAASDAGVESPLTPGLMSSIHEAVRILDKLYSQKEATHDRSRAENSCAGMHSTVRAGRGTEGEINPDNQGD